MGKGARVREERRAGTRKSRPTVTTESIDLTPEQIAMIENREPHFALCKNCGLFFAFQSPILGISVYNSKAGVGVMTFTCPRCGSPADVLNLKATNLPGGTIVGTDPKVLELLSALAQRAMEDAWTPDKLADEIERVEPRLAKFAAWCRDNPVLAGAMIAGGSTVLAAVLAAMIAIFVLAPNQHQAPQPDLTIVVETVVNNLPSAAATTSANTASGGTQSPATHAPRPTSQSEGQTRPRP